MKQEEPTSTTGATALSSPTGTGTTAIPPRRIEVRINKLAANIICLLLTLVLCAASVVLAHLLPHFRAPVRWHLYLLLISLLIVVIVHEALHAIGAILFGKASWCDFKFGVMWRALMPYCHCKKILTVDQYRRMTLLPLQVTGIATLAALIVFPTDALGILLGATLGMCVGDIWIAFKMRIFESSLLVQDCPSDVGCDVIVPDQSSPI